MVKERAQRRENNRSRKKQEVAIELEHGCWQYAGESVELVNAVISADRRQMTEDFFVSMCMVSGVPSLRITHLRTLTPLQPTAHLASMEYPPNISLYSLSTHHSSRFDYFFLSLCIHIYKSVKSQPTAVAVTCVCRDVIQQLSFFQNLVQNIFCYDTRTLRTSMWPR